MIAGALVMGVVLAAAAPSAPAGTGGLATCRAPAPAVGTRFSGFVLLVQDGASLCLAKGPNPRDWIAVRLPSPDAAPDRQVLMAAVFAQKLDCQVLRRDGAAVIARCWRARVALGEVQRRIEVRTQAAAWR